MLCKRTVLPQIRDTDPDCLIGIKGAARSFQNIHQWYLQDIHKGNDELPERYGAAWIYTRMHVSVDEKMDLKDDLVLTTWMEPYRRPVIANMNFLIEQRGRIVARGRAECCVYSLTGQHPMMFSEIEFPDNMPEEMPDSIPPFIGLKKSAEDMEERYRKVVRYSDVDRNNHMSNLRYIEMFQDAYSREEWAEMNPREMEISFCSQCREGETLSVRSRIQDETVSMAAVHTDGRIAAVVMFGR